MSILRAASAMPQLPHGNRAVSRLLINECVSFERRLHHLEIERLLRCEAVEAAAPHEQNLIDQDIALRAQLAGITRLAENTRRRIASAVAKPRESDLDQRDPVQIRHEPAGRSEEHTSELQSLMRISYA